ncbi:MAG: PD40 domain-containing protein, partial [Acidobacteria bacterium]|nr:PD40 domain-containing protein [Acidobacteriota bacterium]
ALRLVKWRLRDISKPESRVVMERMPVCANCHSFSADGATMGMDLDGLQNNKGQYFRAPLAPQTTVNLDNLIQWRSPQGRLRNQIRVGFMSQLSPDGRFVATTLNPSGPPPGQAGPPSNYYVMNFPDYRFLQVVVPTRGAIHYFNPSDGLLHPLPGADLPQYVQFGAVWSPDSSYLVFARADARDPNPEGAPAARYANDPNERQIQYDLYRIPFNNGRGGTATPLAGASTNGMSNTFPKVSPDGRWIVFVKARNGQLMRPDSELWIIPSAGGEPRRMNCNTALMNSWHSFSPNSRWLVFSSKARSPYTQMYLTHIDENGIDSPPILIENSTASNRAVNLPEFVNVKPGTLESLGGPALDFYRLYDRAAYLQKQNDPAAAVQAWQRVLALRPDDEMALNQLGVALLKSGRPAEARQAMQRAAHSRARRLSEEQAR